MATAVAEASVKLILDQDPLRHALGNLGNVLTSPLRDAAKLANSVLGRSFQDIGKSWRYLLQGNIGGAFAGIGYAATDALSGAVRTSSGILGELAGRAVDTAGTLAAGLTEGVFKLTGAATKALGDLATTGGAMMGGLVRSVSGGIGDVLNFIPVVGPLLGGAVKMVGGGIASGIELVGNVIGTALAVIGGAVTKIGTLVAGAIESITRLASTAVRTLIPLAGGIVGGLIDAVGHGASGALGTVINAITNPVKRALSRDLFDLNQSVGELIGKQAGMAKFGAIFQAMGDATGFSKAQMDSLVRSVAQFGNRGVGEITQAAQALLNFSGILQGQQFRKALELSPGLANLLGGDAGAAAHELGQALSGTGHSLMMVNRAMQLFTATELKNIEAMFQNGKASEAQDMILARLGQRVGTLNEAMAGTTQGKLQALSRTWSNIARAIAAPLMPLVDIATDIATSIVKTLGGAAKPILGDITKLVGGWANSIKSFLKENEGTFEEWGSLVKGIVGNVWNLLKQQAGQLLNLDAGQAKDYWEAFKSGLTEALKWLEDATSSWENFQDAADEAWEWIQDKAGDVWKELEAQGKAIWKKVEVTATSLWKELKGQAQGYWEDFQKAAIPILEDLGDALSIALLRAVKAFVAALTNILTTGPLASVLRFAGFDVGDTVGDAIVGGKIKDIEEARDARRRGQGAGAGIAGAIAGGAVGGAGNGGGDFGGAGQEPEQDFGEMEGEGADLERGLARDARKEDRQAKRKERATQRFLEGQWQREEDTTDEFARQEELDRVKGKGGPAGQLQYSFSSFDAFAKKLQESINPSGQDNAQQKAADGIEAGNKEREEHGKKLDKIITVFERGGTAIYSAG